MHPKATPKHPTPVRRPGPELAADLDELLYGYPERPGIRRNPIQAVRLG